MALTLSNSNYNGEVLDKLYLAVGVGNEVVDKAAAILHAGISTEFSLPKLSQTDNPIGDYVSGAPSAVTVTTTYAERSLEPKKMTVYETFSPTTFHDVWNQWKSQGDFSNLELNSAFMSAVIELYQNGIGRQMSKLFFQGNTALAADDAMNKFQGIITRASADGAVIKPAAAGNITSSNFFEILAAVWEATPDHLLDSPDYSIYVNTTDWKTMMSGNTSLRKDFVGVFGMDLETMYQTKRIKHFAGMKRHNILGAHNENLHLGVYVAPDEESVVMDKVAANSREWFFRFDFKADANYSNAADLVLYEPA